MKLIIELYFICACAHSHVGMLALSAQTSDVTKH